MEYEIDKTLGIRSHADVEKMGVANYNAECRKIVMRYSSEWEVRGEEEEGRREGRRRREGGEERE